MSSAAYDALAGGSYSGPSRGDSPMSSCPRGSRPMRRVQPVGKAIFHHVCVAGTPPGDGHERVDVTFIRRAIGCRNVNLRVAKLVSSALVPRHTSDERATRIHSLGLEALPPVRKAIRSGFDTKTITLSCGKLTTGVTVSQWSSILRLRNLRSPETYFQAAFRCPVALVDHESERRQP